MTEERGRRTAGHDRRAPRLRRIHPACTETTEPLPRRHETRPDVVVISGAPPQKFPKFPRPLLLRAAFQKRLLYRLPGRRHVRRKPALLVEMRQPVTIPVPHLLTKPAFFMWLAQQWEGGRPWERNSLCRHPCSASRPAPTRWEDTINPPSPDTLSPTSSAPRASADHNMFTRTTYFLPDSCMTSKDTVTTSLDVMQEDRNFPANARRRSSAGFPMISRRSSNIPNRAITLIPRPTFFDCRPR